jgi:MoxR-like ATPase
MLKSLQASINPEQLTNIQKAVTNIHVSDALLDYVQALLDYSRQSTHIATGLSPRAGLALLHCAQAWALMAERDHVLPEDVQTVLPHVVSHRLQPVADSGEQGPATLVSHVVSHRLQPVADSGEQGPATLVSLLESVPIP